jgi:hypothetical protein
MLYLDIVRTLLEERFLDDIKSSLFDHFQKMTNLKKENQDLIDISLLNQTP